MNPDLKVIEDGGVASARGFRAGGIHAGFRHDPRRLDFALVESDQPCVAAGVFTQNVFCAAPVILSKQRLNDVGYGIARAVMINSGIANAATGSLGLQNAQESSSLVAAAVGCPDAEVLVASTGIIGQHLQIDPFRAFATPLHEKLSSEGGHDAARAIMTTDTVPKESAVTYASSAAAFEGMEVTVGGMVKGSGMIMPNMATMIAVITTDAPIDGPCAHAALKQAVDKSFNKVTVDSDTSTNDTCFLLASGEAGPADAASVICSDSPAFAEFRCALERVCSDLARKIASDGEGATRLITVNVSQAQSEEDADKVARAIANSPLVKTAVFGHDANWGRIAAAAGKCGARFEQANVDIDILGLAVLREGLPVEFDEEEALRRFEDKEVVIDIALGAGNSETTVWTCDFTHDYVSINGDYRS